MAKPLYGSAMNTLSGMFNYQLPNGAGSYSASGSQQAPLVAPPVVPVNNNPPVQQNPQLSTNIAPKQLFNQSAEQPVTPEVQSPTEPQIPQNYINPVTGELYSAKEIVNNMAKKIPMTNSDIGQYAGDTAANPNQSVADMTKTARELNNARNDIAVGETDPFDIVHNSGIAYSPTQLSAIEKAYAGIYDPAINDVFARIKEKQALDDKVAKAKNDIELEKAKKDIIRFNTDENIRQWKATTGTRNEDGSSGRFTKSQINDGASNAGVDIGTFANYPDDLKNFYVNPPMKLDEDTNKKVPQYEVFNNLVDQINNGGSTKDAAEAIITSSTLPSSVKQHFISQLPNTTPQEKMGWWSQIVDWATK